MDRKFTIVVKPERKEQKPLPSVSNVDVVLRHFYRHCYKSSMLWFTVGRTKALIRSS
jgi:hypothetical protein